MTKFFGEDAKVQWTLCSSASIIVILRSFWDWPDCTVSECTHRFKSKVTHVRLQRCHFLSNLLLSAPKKQSSSQRAREQISHLLNNVPCTGIQTHTHRMTNVSRCHTNTKASFNGNKLTNQLLNKQHQKTKSVRAAPASLAFVWAMVSHSWSLRSKSVHVFCVLLWVYVCVFLYMLPAQ